MIFAKDNNQNSRAFRQSVTSERLGLRPSYKEYRGQQVRFCPALLFVSQFINIQERTWSNKIFKSQFIEINRSENGKLSWKI